MGKMSLAEMEALFGFGQFDTVMDIGIMGLGAVGGAVAWEQIAKPLMPPNFLPGGSLGWVNSLVEAAAGGALAIYGPGFPGPRTVGTAATGAAVGLMAGAVKDAVMHFTGSGVSALLPGSGTQMAAEESGTGYFGAAPIQVETEDELAGLGAAPIQIESEDQMGGFGAAPIEISTDDQDLAGIAVSF